MAGLFASIGKDLYSLAWSAGPFLCALAALVVSACDGDLSTASRDAQYVAALLGANERPASTRSPATGSATISVTGNTAEYVVTASGFTTPLVAGHIHIGGFDVVGQVVVPFSIVAQSGVVASGRIDLSVPVTYNTLTISPDSLRRLFDTGQAYVNMHTAAWPDGEIRGQIIKER